jgi:hypothetical protein
MPAYSLSSKNIIINALYPATLMDTDMVLDAAMNWRSCGKYRSG